MQNIISQVPAHLTKTLYIPRYDDSTTHYAIYDISEEYSEKVGVLPMGSEEYKVNLSLLRKPSGYHAGDNTRFLVHVSGTAVSIHERCMGRDPLEAEVSLPAQKDSDVSFRIDTSDGPYRVDGNTNYPLPEREHKKMVVRYPYLTISDSMEPVHLEWQVYPVENGPLRYELVDLRHNDGEGSIRAVYNHRGFENELPTSYSHGILLLPITSTPLFDMTAVSSLTALLSTVRKNGAVRKRSSIRSYLLDLCKL